MRLARRGTGVLWIYGVSDPALQDAWCGAD